MNHDYPEASYARRREVIREHETYQKGWLWFIANDPRVPEEVQVKMREWGLPKDEFRDNGNWSHQLYIREARRMVGSYVMTENDLLKKRATPDSVGMGSYGIDSHNIQRYVTPEGFVQNEGDIGVGLRAPYEIAYGSLVPRKGQAANLLVPVCASSSHIAYGSIRMEPVFMILGESAATAACMAIDDAIAVQDLPYEKLRAQLLKDGQILEYVGKPKVDLAPKLPGIVLDDTDAKREGKWKEGSLRGTQRVGGSYLHDQNEEKGKASLSWSAEIPDDGTYEITLFFPPNPNRATSAPVHVTFSDRQAVVISSNVNQREKTGSASLGKFTLRKDTRVTVTLSNNDTDGYVVADGVQILKIP